MEYQASVDGEVDGLIRRLHQVASWVDWMEGLESVDLGAGSSEAVLVFSNPRRFTLRLDVECQADGLFCSLIEGDVTGVQADVRITPESDGRCLVTWELYLHFPLTVPGVLITELRTCLIPRWNQALALPKSGPADD